MMFTDTKKIDQTFTDEWEYSTFTDIERWCLQTPKGSTRHLQMNGNKRNTTRRQRTNGKNSLFIETNGEVSPHGEGTTRHHRMTRKKLDVYRHQRRGGMEIMNTTKSSTDDREKLDVYRNQRRGNSAWRGVQLDIIGWLGKTRRLSTPTERRKLYWGEWTQPNHQRMIGKNSTFIDTNGEED